MLWGCVRDSVSLPGTNHTMCPGGPELPLNTMCNVGGRLRGLLQEQPVAGENLALGSQGSQNRNLADSFWITCLCNERLCAFKELSCASEAAQV